MLEQHRDDHMYACAHMQACTHVRAQINRYYLLFLRVTPTLPNWFINAATPLMPMQLKDFVIATYVGIMPATFIAVEAGVIG